MFGSDFYGRSATQQAGFQLAGIGVTLALAIVGGVITGIFTRANIVHVRKDKYFRGRRKSNKHLMFRKGFCCAVRRCGIWRRKSIMTIRCFGRCPNRKQRTRRREVDFGWLYMMCMWMAKNVLIHDGYYVELSNSFKVQ